jgi:hypothetical protein
MKIEINVYHHILPGGDAPGSPLEERIMGATSDKIAALKTEFDAALARVEAKLANEATTAADLASIDDMTTRAKGLATDTGTTPGTTEVPPVEMPPTVP